MLKNIVSFCVVLLVTIVFTTSSSAQNKRIENFQKDLNKAFNEAKETAVFNDKDQVIQVEITPLSETKKERFQIEYGKNNTITVTRSNGVKIQIVKNEAGQIKEIIYPDGGKTVFEWETSKFSSAFPSRIEVFNPDGTIKSNNSVNFAVDAPLDACSRAINSAGAAALAASVTCATIGGAPCAAAIVVAGVAAYNAYEACNES